MTVEETVREACQTKSLLGLLKAYIAAAECDYDVENSLTQRIVYYGLLKGFCRQTKKAGLEELHALMEYMEVNVPKSFVPLSSINHLFGAVYIAGMRIKNQELIQRAIKFRDIKSLEGTIESPKVNFDAMAIEVGKYFPDEPTI